MPSLRQAVHGAVLAHGRDTDAVAKGDAAKGQGFKETGHESYMYPWARSCSNACSLSASCARVLRSATLVLRSSSMISGIVVALESTGKVQGAQPRLR